MYYSFCPQVKQNEADLGLGTWTCFKINDYDCSHATSTSHVYWISRAPRPLLPMTNIIRIFDTDCWVMILISMISVSVFLVMAAKLGTHYGVGTEDWVDVVLVPFR